VQKVCGEVGVSFLPKSQQQDVPCPFWFNDSYKVEKAYADAGAWV
jgi:hypothetical protein